ncbi:MAG: hypothetical protein U0930_21485 [Pirellulales bacterium]
MMQEVALAALTRWLAKSRVKVDWTLAIPVALRQVMLFRRKAGRRRKSVQFLSG